MDKKSYASITKYSKNSKPVRVAMQIRGYIKELIRLVGHPQFKVF